MNKKNLLLSVSAFTIMLFTGCSTSTQYVGIGTSKIAPITMGIDRQDFEKAADEMLKSLLTGNTLNKPGGGRYVVMMSDITNDTTERIDTRMLTKKIRKAMLRSGKAIMTAAVGTERDDTTISTRKLRGNKEFDQNTIAQEGTLINAELGLKGRILQRIAKTDDDDQLVEYYFQLELTNARNGLVYWEDESVIGKLGSNDSVTW